MRDKTCNECIDFVAHRNSCFFHDKYTMAKARGCYFFEHITKGDIVRQMSNEELADTVEELRAKFERRRELIEWLNAEAEPAEIEKMRDAQRKKEENYD